MLSRENKIPKIQYASLLKKSKYFSIDGNTIRFSDIKDGPRFSIIISAKVSKKAVQRNLIRRVFYNKIKDINKKPSKKAIFIYASKDFGKMNRKQINEKVEFIINKICLYFQKG